MPSPSTPTGATEVGVRPQTVGRRAATGATAATAATAQREVWLSVGEMSCGSCAARLQNRLNAMPDVEATVNFATERAQVRTKLPTSEIVEAVQEAGFSARVVPTQDLAQGLLRTEADQRARTLGRRLIVAGLLFMPLCDASIAFSLVPSVRFAGWQWLVLALAAPVVTWCAWPFYAAALRQARHGIATMDTLASIGILAATGWSVYAAFVVDTGGDAARGAGIAGGSIYLDVAAGVTTFLLAGRYFEARVRRRATDALGSLAAVGAKEVSIIDAGGTERLHDVSELIAGDCFVVRSGETVAADGRIEAGRGVIDSRSMTGEAMPVEVGPGDRVIGGTVALDGWLTVRAEAVGADTQLAMMLDLVARAQNEKASAQRLADRIAGYFVPAVLIAAAATLSGWLLAGAGTATALNAGLSVLIIACPCALGLATPMALLVASDRGARSGIFFKGYGAVESSGRIDTVLFDKTGTITDGRMSLVGVAAAPGYSETEVVRFAASVEQASSHPLARAIAGRARQEFDLSPVEAFRSLPGAGAQGLVEGHAVAVGSLSTAGEGVPGVLPEDLRRRCDNWEGTARTVVYVFVDGSVIGAMALSDTVRPTAVEAIRQLKQLGLRCILLTGDNARVAAAVTQECGLDGFVADVSPPEKAAEVVRLQGTGARVAMVGDGVNDGPALAQADLGLALGSGTDVARNSADLLVIRDDLRVVPNAVRLARKTNRTIHGNLAWAFGYNVVAIPLAACGLLNPLIAAAAMALSSGFVVWNSARLRNFRDTVARGGSEESPS